MTLTDITPMPFGKYKGVPMEDVEASYLLRILNEGFNGKAKREHVSAVQEYAYNNKAQLKDEVAQFAAIPMPEYDEMTEIDECIDFDMFNEEN
jgi:hypothetical protein